MKNMCKKLLPFLLILLLMMNTALGETVTFHNKLTVEKDTESIDYPYSTLWDLEEFITFLKKLPNLKTVDMFDVTLKKKQMDQLTEALPDVSFGCTLKIAEDHLVRTDATAFSTLHWSNNTDPHSSNTLSVLKYCKNLQALDIGHNDVESLEFLRELPQLKVLIIACNNIVDISPLAELTELEYLEMFSNRVVDLSPLAGLTNLVDLNIGYNTVGDWSPLHELKQLERLWIYNSCANFNRNKQVPQEVIEQLRLELPDTYLDTESMPTLGGWREHPRYDIIHAIFETGEYRPFED